MTESPNTACVCAAAAIPPWTYKPEAGWQLIGDTATTVEALLVLDHALTTHGTWKAARSERR